jgi:hypothetical protein
MAQPVGGQPANVVYNPTPPVKPVAKKTTGCLSVLVFVVGLAPPLGMLVAATLH